MNATNLDDTIGCEAMEGERKREPGKGWLLLVENWLQERSYNYQVARPVDGSTLADGIKGGGWRGRMTGAGSEED